jgi:hypothetical protein
LISFFLLSWLFAFVLMKLIFYRSLEIQANVKTPECSDKIGRIQGSVAIEKAPECLKWFFIFILNSEFECVCTPSVGMF